MSLLLRTARRLQKVSSLNPAAAYGSHAHPPGTPYPAHATDDYLTIGDREEVGYGLNGKPNYLDRQDCPLPAIRFKANTPDILVLFTVQTFILFPSSYSSYLSYVFLLLREKEKGDWKKLSMEEKKQLYRASFCQTFAEIEAPTGEWKTILGTTLFFTSLGLWLFILAKKFVYNPEPPTMSPEGKKWALKRYLDIAENPIEGLASHWDYENNDWKHVTQKK